jgi:twitching motility protein PilT
MANQRVIPLLGRLAVHNRMISMGQLSEATDEQGRRRDETTLGEILVEKGFISALQLKQLLHAQREMLARQRAKLAAESAAPGMEEPPQPTVKPARTPAPPEPDLSIKPAEADANLRPEPVAAPPAQAPAERGAETAAPPVPESAAGPVLAEGHAVCVPSESDRAEFDELIQRAVERGASDIHLHAGAPIKFRISGGMEAEGESVLDPEHAERLALSPLTADQREQFVALGEIDFAYTLRGGGRLRANVYRQQRGVDGVFRFIPPKPPSLEDLGLPTSIAKYINYHQGMVLVTGPTGCGKSSTLAALVDLINEERKEHILTIEDPIEYLHPSKRCLVNQRGVQNHTESFARALRAALREDPDVIVIGELRDLETISLALSAAETGHLVLATLHTNNAIRTLNRLIGAFPADQQGQIRMMISESLRAVISQRLIPRADGQGRVAAVEVMVVTRAVGNLIRENKTFQIHSILQTGASQGMTLLDHAIKAHLDAGTITREEALRQCEDEKVLGG